jgi:23S rRNA pseudouridine1911/1915/1917 synthase
MQNESQTNFQTIIATLDDINKRLDAFVSEKIEGWSRSKLVKLIENGDILVNGKITKPKYKIHKNDEIEIELIETLSDNFEPENIPLEIVFEDEYLAVINKPAGMVVHPAVGNRTGTLANAIAFHFQIQNPKSEIQNRAGIVHRLDKDTSGLIVVAKNQEIQESLSEQFRNREVFKQYIALVHGHTKEDKGLIDEPIGRDRNNRVKMAINNNGRNAISIWKVRERFENFTLLDVEIKTGRTHQIRVHLGSIKHGVVNDELYNNGRDNNVQNVLLRKEIKKLGRFFLHAEKLFFKHPKTDDYLKFIQPLPAELDNFLEKIRKLS